MATTYRCPHCGIRSEIAASCRILSPGEAAELMGVSVPILVALIRKYRYDFTETVPGGKPGDRGRNQWGLTEAQVQTIVKQQCRGYQAPASEVAAVPAILAGYSPHSPDGKRRVRPTLGRLAS